MADHACANVDLYDVDSHKLELDVGHGRRAALQVRLNQPAEHQKLITDAHHKQNHEQLVPQLMVVGVAQHLHSKAVLVAAN